jgi:hypothetical protein
MARPTKLTAEVEERLVDAISVGATYKDACACAGISYQTFLNWQKRAEREDDERFVGFLDRIKRAQGQAALVLLAQIKEAAKRDWRAAAWSLERRYPDSYGRHPRAEPLSWEDATPRPASDVTPPSDKETFSKIARIMSEYGFLSS